MIAAFLFVVVVVICCCIAIANVVLYVVVLVSCICHNCFVGLFVYCVVTFPCGRLRSQDRLYKHDSKNREPYRLQQI